MAATGAGFAVLGAGLVTADTLGFGDVVPAVVDFAAVVFLAGFGLAVFDAVVVAAALVRAAETRVLDVGDGRGAAEKVGVGSADWGAGSAEKTDDITTADTAGMRTTSNPAISTVTERLTRIPPHCSDR